MLIKRKALELDYVPFSPTLCFVYLCCFKCVSIMAIITLFALPLSPYVYLISLIVPVVLVVTMVTLLYVDFQQRGKG